MMAAQYAVWLVIGVGFITMLALANQPHSWHNNTGAKPRRFKNSSTGYHAVNVPASTSRHRTSAVASVAVLNQWRNGEVHWHFLLFGLILDGDIYRVLHYLSSPNRVCRAEIIGIFKRLAYTTAKSRAWRSASASCCLKEGSCSSSITIKPSCKNGVKKCRSCANYYGTLSRSCPLPHLLALRIV